MTMAAAAVIHVLLEHGAPAFHLSSGQITCHVHKYLAAGNVNEDQLPAVVYLKVKIKRWASPITPLYQKTRSVPFNAWFSPPLLPWQQQQRQQRDLLRYHLSPFFFLRAIMT